MHTEELEDRDWCQSEGKETALSLLRDLTLA